MIETILCLLFGGAILWKGFWGLREDLRSDNFSQVEAKFYEARITKDEGHYGITLVYKYEFDEETYTYEHPARNSIGNESILFLSTAQEKVKQFTEKKESVHVYVGSRNPARARTETGANPMMILEIILGGIFFLIGVRLLIFP